MGLFNLPASDFALLGIATLVLLLATTLVDIFVLRAVHKSLAARLTQPRVQSILRESRIADLICRGTLMLLVIAGLFVGHWQGWKDQDGLVFFTMAFSCAMVKTGWATWIYVKAYREGNGPLLPMVLIFHSILDFAKTFCFGLSLLILWHGLTNLLADR